ncbi:MAG: hypothetical protein WC819_01005 [Parcubacteria group bacterium]|jgi:hypothetical protein
MNLPSLMSGESVIVREELVPFFDFKSQFLDQIKGGESYLTMTDEIRVAYSFWTSWMRYWIVLPFALIILNSISAFLFFISVYMIEKEIFKKNSNFIMTTSFLTSFFIYLILLYSKVTHFYTLIFGFSLFALAISMTIREFFFRDKFSLKSSIWISILVLFNPAIHYHILYYIVFSLVVSFIFLMNDNFKGETIKFTKYFSVLMLISLFPYVIFILYVINNTDSDITTSIAVNFMFIFNTSTSLTHIFSLDIAAPVDMFLHGKYLTDLPRYSKILFFLILLLPLAFTREINSQKSKKFIIFSYFVLTIAIWMSIGYLQEFSFHSIGSDFMIYLSQFSSWGVNIVKKIVGTTIQILRFPHRFEFILFYITPILATFSFAFLKNKFGYGFVIIAIFLSVGMPFIIDVDHRTFLASGNYGGFLSPMRIPSDLKKIKSIIHEDLGVGFILPTFESGRDMQIDDKNYNFIDKFLIYYLDSPTFYYGTGAKTENRIRAFLVYQAILDDSTSWENVLNSGMNVKYIINPHTVSKTYGNVYLPEIDNKLDQKLNDSLLYQRVYTGEYFDLYKRNIEKKYDNSIMLDVSSEKIFQYLKLSEIDENTLYFPLQEKKFLQGEKAKILVTDSLESSYYNLLVLKNDSISHVYPDSDLLPFTKGLMPSTFYTNMPLSLEALLGDNSYNFFGRPVTDMINLSSPQFIGIVDKNFQIKFSFKIKDVGKHRLILKASTSENKIFVTLSGKEVELKRMDQNTNVKNKENFSYFYADYDFATKGNYFLGVKKESDDGDPLLVESLSAVPQSLFYEENDSWVGSEYLKLIRSNESEVYHVEIHEE